ncbi:hypothetical protein [Bosea sp. NPDC055594]
MKHRLLCIAHNGRGGTNHMALAQHTSNGIAFCKDAIMRRAYQHARFALQLCRTPEARNEQRARALRKAWAEAKREVSALIQRAEEEARARAALAARAAEAVAQAGTYGRDADAIRQAIASELYRERANFARIDQLTAALNQIGA